MNPIIYVLGSSNLDLITLSTRIPSPGETVIGKQYYTRCGGKGANQAVAIAKLCKDKSKMCFVSLIGNDSNGVEISKKLSEVGMRLDEVKVIDDICTGIASICIDDKGENSIIVVPGANGCFTSSIFDEIKISNCCKVIVLQLEIPIPTVKHILEFCKKRGIISILNPAPASSELLLDDPAFQWIDYFIPNETESQFIAGLSNNSSKEVIMDTLLQANKQMTVIMTLGGEGAFVGYEDQRKVVSCPQIHVKDTVGAGDCFVGTFAYLLADYIDSTSKPIDFSTLCTFVQRSCYASSYSVQFSGGFDKYPTEIIEEWDSSYVHYFVCFD